MTHTDLRLRAEGLDFWVDVHVHRFDGGWLAVADLAGEPELGWADEAAGAVKMALAALGPVAQRRLFAVAQQQLADR